MTCRYQQIKRIRLDYRVNAVYVVNTISQIRTNTAATNIRIFNMLRIMITIIITIIMISIIIIMLIIIIKIIAIVINIIKIAMIINMTTVIIMKLKKYNKKLKI